MPYELNDVVYYNSTTGILPDKLGVVVAKKKLKNGKEMVRVRYAKSNTVMPTLTTPGKKILLSKRKYWHDVEHLDRHYLKLGPM